MKSAAKELKELIRKKRLSDHEVARLLSIMSKTYKSKYWGFAEEILSPFTAEEGDIDELLSDLESGVKTPLVLNLKLIKSQNSRVCGEDIDPALIGQNVFENKGQEECKGEVIGREIPCIPVVRVPFIQIRINNQGRTRNIRVFPTSEDLDSIFSFMERKIAKVNKMLTQMDIEEFQIRRASLLFVVANVNNLGWKLFQIPLSPVDSVRVGNFERKLRQMTGMNGLLAACKIGKLAVLSSVKVEVKGQKVIAVDLRLGDRLEDYEEWKPVLIPIAAAIKNNWLNKMPHDLSAEAVEEADSPSDDTGISTDTQDVSHDDVLDDIEF